MSRYTKLGKFSIHMRIDTISVQWLVSDYGLPFTMLDEK